MKTHFISDERAPAPVLWQYAIACEPGRYRRDNGRIVTDNPDAVTCGNCRRSDAFGQARDRRRLEFKLARLQAHFQPIA